MFSHPTGFPHQTDMNPTDSQPKSPKPGTRPTGFRARTEQGVRANTGSKTKGKAQTSPNSKPETNAAPSPAASVQTTPRNAPPMKKRAKGSGFLGLIFVGAFLILGYTAWSSLLQYQAFGVIEGRVISVAAPWDGSLTSWEVRDGEVVKQGQVLAEIKNLDMEHKLATLGDELKMSQALLEAEMSKIRFERHNLGEQNQRLHAEFHTTSGELKAEEETYKELSRKYERARRLLKSNNISRSAYESIFFKLAGQKKRVEHLTAAVNVLRQRSDNVIDKPDGETRLKPLLSEIELTQFKIERLREKIDQGQIRSPVTGRVSKRLLLTGESTKASEAVIDILEDNSIEAVLYLPQRVVDEYEVGKIVDVAIEPYTHSMQCRVERFGDRFETAPATIQRFYQINQPLLPVYLTPLRDTSEMLAARIGGTIKRPYNYSKSAQRLWDDGKGFVNRITGQIPAKKPATGHQRESQQTLPIENVVTAKAGGTKTNPQALTQNYPTRQLSPLNSNATQTFALSNFKEQKPPTLRFSQERSPVHDSTTKVYSNGLNETPEPDSAGLSSEWESQLLEPFDRDPAIEAHSTTPESHIHAEKQLLPIENQTHKAIAQPDPILRSIKPSPEVQHVELRQKNFVPAASTFPSSEPDTSPSSSMPPFPKVLLRSSSTRD